MAIITLLFHTFEYFILIIAPLLASPRLTHVLVFIVIIFPSLTHSRAHIFHTPIVIFINLLTPPNYAPARDKMVREWRARESEREIDS
jgi:hypothetical protein